MATTTLVPLKGAWQQAAGAWLAEVQARTGSTRTPVEYARILARFLDTADPGQVTPALVHAFAYGPGPSGKEPSPSTIVVRLAAIDGFYGFARRMGLLATNPAADVRRPRLRQPAPRGLGEEELRRLLTAVPVTPAGQRDRAIILTMVLTGLRRAEVMGLRAGALTDQGGVTYYSTVVKGGHHRQRELPRPAFKAICTALTAQGRPLDTLAPEDRLFAVSSMAFYLALARYARKAGLVGVTPHVLRHSAAKLRRLAGASIEDVGALLGHRSIATTARYLARLEGEQDPGWRGAAAILGVAGD
jgi:integrase/recombinase XerD